MANLITLSRLLLLFVLAAIAYHASPLWQLLHAPLIVAIFASDGLDGYVARKRGEDSLFGSLFDIAIDRVVENVLWIVLADLDLVPVWVPIVFITRGAIVDTLRGHGAAQGSTPFGMMHSELGRFLVAGRFMRIGYAVVKAIAFGWILFFQPLPALAPDLWAQVAGPAGAIGMFWVYAAVALCLLRGLPVVWDFALGMRRDPDLRP
jgi:CDP-diacylglycerol--glycerol-3-phosphate 3-phosphatidyltransferase